jgi:Ima1 N-terminal domain
MLQNGEIADVPPNETASPRQYARAVAPTDTQPFEEVVFCSTCIKNQQLLTEALSNYLPAPEDPTYPQYEASLPIYRRNLEDRYPQVCPKCEPAVQQRILQAGYHAKSDHLRRMMDRSRARQTANRWGWRSLVVRGGGLGYTTSIVGQLCWHAMSALSYGDANTGTVSYRSCLVQCLQKQQPYTDCAELFASVAGLAIVVGLMCIWWNPRWHHKLDGKDGRLTGLHTYYNIQVISLLLRLGSWIWLRDPATSGISQLHQKAAHNLFLVLELILAAFSLFGVVRVDTTPLVNWQAGPAPLLSKRQYVPPEQSPTQLFSPPSSQLESSTSQAFPVNNLASSVGPSYDAWRPPTPPEEDPNAMEWEPTSNLQVKPRRIHQKPVTQPSPFYGTLPALPTNRLLHPKPQSLSQPRQAIGVPPGFFDRVSGNASRTQRNSTEAPRLAQPKFFPPSDREADTGLEGMFSSVFSLNTDPTEVRERSTPQPMQHRNKPAPTPPHCGSSLWTTKLIHGISAAISLVGLLTWIFMSYLSVSWPLVRFVITSATAMIPVVDAVLNISRPVSQRRFGEITGFLVEFCALLVFGLNKVYGGLLDVEKCDLAVAGVLSILCWQEFFLCFAHNEDARQNLPSGPDLRALPGISSPAERPHQAFSRADDEPEAKPFMHHSPSQQSQPPGEVSAFSPRFRSNSIDSTATEVSTASTVTTSGWKTPRRKERGPSQSPGFTLGSLALDDGLSSSSSRVIGPTQQHTRRRGAF